MDSKIKEEKLRNFVKEVMEYPEYKVEIEHLFSKLNLIKEQVIRTYVKYDMDVFAYGNEIYESLEARMILNIHYLLKGSWHQDRQKAILEIIKKNRSELSCRYGFWRTNKIHKRICFKKEKETCPC